ncbi:MAG: DUF448 domain-containing protein [Rhodothalassiaceae bacterium]
MVAHGRKRAVPRRRCILCREGGERQEMIRLVLAEDGTAVPDLGERLPGRGAWIHASRAALEAACRSGQLARALSRALRTTVRADRVAPDFVQRLDALLRARLLQRLGLARRAGWLVTGFEKVRARLERNAAGVLIEARDAAADGRRQLAARSAAIVHRIDMFDRTELGLALGRENVVHAAIESGGLTPGLMRDLRRLSAWYGRSCPEFGDGRGRSEQEIGNPAPGVGLVSHREEQV